MKVDKPLRDKSVQGFAQGRSAGTKITRQGGFVQALTGLEGERGRHIAKLRIKQAYGIFRGCIRGTILVGHCVFPCDVP